MRPSAGAWNQVGPTCPCPAVVFICFGLFIFWSLKAVAAGFPDVQLSNGGSVLLIGVEITTGIAALMFLRWRSLLARVLYHLYQGPEAAVWVAAFGLTLTLAYLATRRLWPVVLAHILWDIVPML